MATDGEQFRATLTTTGRRTSRPHSVVLRAVKHDGKLYFSRHRPDSDWFKNVLANPEVTINYKDGTWGGIARLVEDEILSQKVSQLKYPGEERAREKRVTIEVTLHEQ